MIEWLLRGPFMPHGHCYLWEPAMVWLQVVTNLLIGVAYMSISATLWYLVRRIEDVPFRWMYVAFCVFSVTCGFTHFFDVLTIWTPVYWLDGGMRVLSAIASVVTAVLLFTLVPKAVAFAHSARSGHERRRQLALLHAENLMLAEGIPQMVAVTTDGGEVRYHNRHWVEYCGEPPVSFEKQAHLIHPDDLPEVRIRWQRSLDTGDPYRCEQRVRRHDGVYRWHLGMASPLRDPSGRISGWLSTNTDIEPQKQAEAEREAALAKMQAALQARETFIAVAAHELKTPLTPLRVTIDGLLQLVEQGRWERLTPERTTAKLVVARRQIDRLQRLALRLLDVSRLERGVLELDLEDMDLATAVLEVAERHRNEAAHVCSQLIVDAERGITGHWDRLRIEQVITNLVTNAIKFSAEQPITIRARASAGAASATITVEDHGPGIAAEDQTRIFERFERGAASAQHSGLGLGLWIAAEITRALGGQIELHSKPGAGSTFIVQLPLLGPRPA